MIRQTITCDLCGIERKQANYWFEALEHEGELRIRGLTPNKTTRPGLKHLCGQTCLHRLVDDFLAGNLSSRMFGVHDSTKAPTDFAKIAAKVLSSSDDLDHHDFVSSACLVETSKPRPTAAARPRKAQTQDSAMRSKTAPPAAANSTRKVPVGPEIDSVSAKQTPPLTNVSVPTPAIPSVSSVPTPVRVGHTIVAGIAKPFSSPKTRTLGMSASGEMGPCLQSSSPLTPQVRRAQAWERERARERLATSSNLRNAKTQKFL